MFYDVQSEELQCEYKDLLRLIGGLSNLFSDSSSPYLPYRAHENIFCDALKAENLSRHDISADAKKGKIGIGLKTWVDSDTQKVAEFNSDRENFEGLSDKKLVKYISELRNKRIDFTMKSYGIDEMVYHIVKRTPNTMEIYEAAFDKIDIVNIELMNKGRNKNCIYFTDGNHVYNFNKAKNTLYMIFDNMDLLDRIPVVISSKPYSDLKKLDIVLDESSDVNDSDVKTTDMDTLCLRLYSQSKTKGNYVPEKSGLNGWNAGGRKRNPNEVYIPYPVEDRERNPEFFPPKDKSFDLILPNGDKISASVCQNAYNKMSESKYNNLSKSEKILEDKRRLTGKAIMSNPNSDLGEWLLRTVFEIPEGTIMTYDMLNEYGIDCVVFTKISSSTYSLDFASVGTYEEKYGID